MKTRKAVITAAGRGTRMFPATRAIQKEMLPLIDTDGLVKPTIQMIAEACVAAGIEEICIVVENGGGQAFREHFRAFTDDERSVFAGKDWLLAEGEKLARLAERISYVEQPSPEGFGHAVYQAKDFAGGEPILLLLGDHVYTGDPLGQMLAAGEASGGSVTGVRVEPESGVSVTGIIKGQATQTPGLYEILALQEKPTVAEVQVLKTEGLEDDTYLGHFGIHLFTAEIFDCLGELIATNTRVKNEFQLTSGQELLWKRNPAHYRALLLSGERWDIGLPDEYLKTLAKFGSLGPHAEVLK
ncbi:MAG: sugar phosphate nucleotidyltransferase [Armatimonadetes bacterium]|nr:sugar phosphate nucleotidyltransferase [Armatimonadota bacterium]